ncbi:MAG: efflux RND transporter periplasmic adaptor subunit [Gemmatimonadota bacterium]|nr:efflux RND transporter periplasmic adaptor subunit [Gemmatimonadota bacterium]
MRPMNGSGRYGTRIHPALAALVALALPAAVAACGEGQAEEPTLGLSTVTAERRQITSSVAATGTIEPIRVIDVKSQASGEVLEVPVELGDFVRRGELLVRIDPRDVRNAFEQAEADLDVARARHTIAQRQLGRVTDLRDSQVVTEEEYETALLEEANAKASLVKAETNLELARDRLNDVAVAAPIDGIVVEKTAEEGQIITSAREVTGGTILLRMADLNEVQVRTLVDETDIGVIEPGLRATIRVEAYPEREFTGSVLKIEPQAVVEQNVTLFAVLTRIRNEEGLLKPGMNADVEILIGRRDDVLALPNAAVKTVDEARQLASALGLDPELLQARAADPTAEPADGGEPTESAAAGGDAADGDGLPSPERLQAMSREERQKLIQRLEPAQRQRLFAMFQQAREQEERQARADPARPRDAFVFVDEPGRGLTPKPIRIGLSSWEFTEVLAGLEAGDTVTAVPMSLVSQQELLDRIRSRSGIPGVSRN